MKNNREIAEQLVDKLFKDLFERESVVDEIEHLLDTYGDIEEVEQPEK